MRVAVVVSTFPPYRGGMGNAAAAHAAALRAAGHEVTVFAPGQALRPWMLIGNSALAPQLWWKLRGFDAVELHYPFFGGAEWVWLWKLTFGRRARLAVMYHMDAVGSGMSGAVFRLYRALFLKRILSSADAVLASSRDYLAASQAGFLSSGARAAETPFGVDAERFRPAASRARGTVLFVGGLDRAHYFKGIGVLLEAFALLSRTSPEATLLVAGDGDLRADYESRAASLGVRARFLGRVSDAELPELYRSAAVHVLPSVDRSEAFGLVTLEAAASGLPSVVSDLPGVRTAVEDGVTGMLVPPSDVAALAAALHALLADPARTDAMGRAARERVVLRHSREAADRAVVRAVTG